VFTNALNGNIAVPENVRPDFVDENMANLGFMEMLGAITKTRVPNRQEGAPIYAPIG
jgi:hypothetical protein